MPATDNNPRFWDRLARKYAASPISDMVGYERTLEATRGYLKPEHVVFEFGCGTGTTALKLAPSAARIVATDLSSEMIAIAREKAAAESCTNIEFAVSTLGSPPWPEGSFDVALGFNVLHLIEDRQAALAGVRRLLKPGGVFISKTPCIGEMNPLLKLAIPLMQAVGKAPYVGVFKGAQLEQEIAAAGFEIVERARHGSKRKDPRIFLVARKST
jgi:ubiquinone/menaquinone biosynthesis C-methylase UbiE